jgi:hypothetical protein
MASGLGVVGTKRATVFDAPTRLYRFWKPEPLAQLSDDVRFDAPVGCDVETGWKLERGRGDDQPQEDGCQTKEARSCSLTEVAGDLHVAQAAKPC